VSSTYYTIVNGAAGSGRSEKLAPAALEDLERRGLSLEAVFTDGPKHAIELARRRAEEGQRRFLSVGGDGTASEVVNGLIRAGVAKECELAMLPLGTGNSFLRDFGITNIEQATNAITRGNSRAIDILRLNHEGGTIHFINTMGTGFVARVGELANERFKHLGAASYVAAVLVCLLRLEYERTALRYDGVTDDRLTVLSSFSNSQYTGGSMRMAPDANVSDGLLDVIRAAPRGRAALLAAFARIFSGAHTELDTVWTRQVDRVDFTDPARQAVLIDGDLFHLTPLSIDVVPRGIQLII
jgi:YegS/Rv2252/BmrU family lipid kinase